MFECLRTLALKHLRPLKRGSNVIKTERERKKKELGENRGRERQREGNLRILLCSPERETDKQTDRGREREDFIWVCLKITGFHLASAVRQAQI